LSGASSPTLTRREKKRGLKEAQAKRNMNTAARSHSKHMAKVGKLAHEGIGDGTPASRGRKHKCGDGLWAENCQGPWSKDYFTYYKTTEQELGKKVVDSWMKSPPHRANLLRLEWVVMGAGVGQTRKGGIYATQIFGDRRQMADEKLVALCPKCKSQSIRPRTSPHEKNLWRCLKCKQVFPAPRTGYRRAAKPHVLATDIQSLASKINAREIRQRRKLTAGIATAAMAGTLAIVACIFLIA
jgi:ribosomal protein L37AE/L43A